MTRPASSDLAWNVHTRRHAKRLSQHEFAALSGVPRSVIARVEAGHLPSLRTVVALAKALDTTPDKLLKKRPESSAA